MLDIDEFHTQLQTRVVGSVALTQACLPLLRQSRGKILWIMTPALIPTPYVTGIHACDFAVACVARTLDIELKGWHIPSIMIRCGGIQTPSGARTVSDVAALLQHDVLKKAHLYEASLTHWAREMVGFDGHRTSPERVAEVVYKVLLSRRPRRRYSVGYMSGAAAFLESLPGSLGDLILKSRF